MIDGIHANKTKLSKTREEMNRLTATIKDLQSHVSELEERNLELSKLEGRYRQRTHDLKDRMLSAQAQNTALTKKLDSMVLDSNATQALSATARDQQKEKINAMDRQLQELRRTKTLLEHQCLRLKTKLEHQHTTMKQQASIMSKQLPIILSDLERAKTEMKSHYERIISTQREQYEKQITRYKIEIEKNASKKEGIAIGRKKQFDCQRLAEKMEMKRLRQDEKQLHEERMRQRSIEVGVATTTNELGEECRPSSILRTLVHRLPSSLPVPDSKMLFNTSIRASKPSAMVNFQLAMARLRQFDDNEHGVEAHIEVNDAYHDGYPDGYHDDNAESSELEEQVLETAETEEKGIISELSGDQVGWC